MRKLSLSTTTRLLVVTALIFAAAAVVPAVFRPLYVILAINVLVGALLGMSFNLLYGYAGMFSFGQAAFYGIGAYGTALIMNATDLGFFAVLVLMTALCAVAGLLLALPLVGLDRIPFVMLTFAAAELLGFGARRLVGITRGDSGLIVNIPPSLNIMGSTSTVFYVVLAAVGFSFLALVLLVRSPFGLTVRSIKQNELRTETLGVDVWRHKVIIFVIAAAVAGVAGSLSAVTSQLVYPSAFLWFVSANALIVTLLGGSGFFLGPLVGSAALGVITLYAGRYTTNLVAVTGVVFLVIVLLAPGGLAGIAQRVRSSLRRREPVVPQRADARPPRSEVTQVP